MQIFSRASYLKQKLTFTLLRPHASNRTAQVVISCPESSQRVLATEPSCTCGTWFNTLRLHSNKAYVISGRDTERHQQMRHILGPSVILTRLNPLREHKS
jgi:hypothetical protein